MKTREWFELSRSLRLSIDDGRTDEQLREQISGMMAEVYRIVGICLGVPPVQFTWEYTDKAKQVVHS
jgi:bleomycin hydrolase